MPLAIVGGNSFSILGVSSHAKVSFTAAAATSAVLPFIGLMPFLSGLWPELAVFSKWSLAGARGLLSGLWPELTVFF